MDVVELRDFNEKGGHGRGAARNEFQVADGGQEGGAPALGILPAFPMLKPEGGKEASETVKLSAWTAGRGDGTDKRDSLNHRFDCIVWEYRTSLLYCMLDCAAEGRCL
jgi:hypothetical protein